jgi:hypothetical protein
MTNSNTYIYKELNINGSYQLSQNERLISSYNIENSDLSFIIPFFHNPSFIENFKNNYSSISILNKTTVLIDDLLKRYHLEDKRLDFYVLVCAIQKEYINLYETPFDNRDRMNIDFQNLHKDVAMLLKIIRSYLLDTNNIQAVSIKTDSNTTFKNMFFIRDIMDALIFKYGLTLENFEVKKQLILDNYHPLKFSLLDEYFKYETILGLYDFIIREKHSNAKIRNRDLRFVGSILHLSQISINAKSHEIILTDLKNLVSTSDINNLNNYLKRPDRYTF